MPKIKLSERTLESMGFQRRHLDDGMYDHVKQLKGGYTVEYGDRLLELVYEGRAVPLPCRSKHHLEQIIEVLTIN